MAGANALLPASYRGAPFLLKSVSVSAGRKTAVHEFVNRDERYVEDLGKQQRKFEVVGIVKTWDSGLSRALLKRALDRGPSAGFFGLTGAGVLILPGEGVVKASVTNYTISEKDASKGIAEFRMSFLETTGPAGPLEKNVFDALSVAGDCVNACLDFMGDALAVVGLTVAATQQIVSAVGDLASALEASSSPLVMPAEAAESLLRSVTDLENSITSIVSGNSTLFSRYTDVFANASTAQTDPLDRATVALEISDPEYFPVVPLINSGSAGADAPSEVAKRAVYNGLELVAQATTLAYGYAAAQEATYPTTDEIVRVQALYEARYQAYLLATEQQTNEASTAAITNALASLRAATNRAFSEKAVATPKVVETTTRVTSMTKLAYDYYESFDNAETLIALNRPANALFVSGPVKILSQ